jgi:uncharacterized membrane protein YeaQ/YmgE (transglycosylase-associated protein family)
VISAIISAIVVGAIIGALGRLVVPGKQNISIWITIAIGIVAALIGTFIANALGVGNTNGIDWIKLIIQVALAAVGVALVAGGARARRRLGRPSRGPRGTAQHEAPSADGAVGTDVPTAPSSCPRRIALQLLPASSIIGVTGG